MKHGVTYNGLRTPKGCLVTVDGAELQQRLDVRKHSPTGFEWGFDGSGPAQLALAMLCDFFNGDTDKALEYYQEFKRDIIAPIGQNTWTIKSESIVEWVRHKMRERRDASKGPVY
jgi:hypothetical protein